MAAQLAHAVASSIQKLGDAKTAVDKAKYFKQVCQFHGLKSAELKTAVQTHLPSLKQLYSEQGKAPIHEICKKLIQSTYHEEKCSVPLIMNLVLDKKPARLSLDDLSFLGTDVFDAGHAFDWATVDSLCGSVIYNVLVNEGNSSDSKASRMLLDWAQSPGGPTPLWKQRASCVAFVKLARHGNHSDVIFDVTDICVRNNERFVQLGVGWVLRELWLAEPQKVVDFITERYHFFSREGLRYAIEKMDKPLQGKLLQYDATKSSKIAITSGLSGSVEPISISKKSKKRAIEEGDELEDDEAPVPKKPRKK